VGATMGVAGSKLTQSGRRRPRPSRYLRSFLERRSLAGVGSRAARERSRRPTCRFPAPGATRARGELVP